MDEIVVEVVVRHCVRIARQTQVTFFKEINILVMIKQDPNTDVELALIDKCRLLNILLNDESCCLNSILCLTSALSLFWEVTCHI